MRRLQERGPVPALTVVGTAAAVVVADQLTKEWALRSLADGPVHVVWTLRFNLSVNPGIAFGLGRGLGPVVVVAGLAMVAVLVGLTRSARLGALGLVAVGLVLGGAVGNLADRVFRDQGGVVDFIDLQWWPIFNVADAGISVGAVLLALRAHDR